ncbi:MAG TPA: hypothetical protein DDZ96_08105 [Porphyromonadaceae bacterium]|jgi:uncharacterized membrane protein YjjP (DUF1212 family)|uniref:threonine/serine ThrE exporter family protein n=1 Tax=Limibacterium fermenti TaxID=3229863 RepID=UPI000E86967A|nr:hypothetical protein [Porphyromonadaceae bacterium]HBL33766.1 hypothetical protein [Porphyromonadaceae bacterium]HCM22271.1 hypothetical protein [Porphyromonadaceae bacterium]
MKSEDELKEIAEFVGEYATCLLGSGVHTSRVMRNTARIGEALGVTTRISTSQKSVVLTISDSKRNVHTKVLTIPALPISFEYNSELSALSWEARDSHLSIDQLKERYYDILSRPKMRYYWILLLVGLANASFCRLFGGDWGAMGIVFVATVVGFFVRLILQKNHVNHFFIVTTSAFVSSMIASVSLLFDVTADIAIATSVLYLIPGVPIINGVIDIVEGHTLSGLSRLIQAVLLVICLAIGLSISLLLFKNSLL